MMIQFDYEGITRQAWQISCEEHGKLFCFQVSPSIGHKYFLTSLMSRVIEIDRAPFEHLFQDMDATGFMGQKGGGVRPCADCGSIDEMNFDQLCPGCETAFDIFAGKELTWSALR